MMNFLKFPFVVIAFGMILQGCMTGKQSGIVKIIIDGSAKVNSTVKISIHKCLDEIDLAQQKLDSSGSGILKINLSEPTMALMQVDEKYAELFLAPGYELVVTPHADTPDEPMSYSGKGADVNNYIAKMNSMVEKIKWADGKSIGRLDIKNFSVRFDSLRTSVTDFHFHYLDSIALPKDLREMLKSKNEIELLAIRQEYVFLLQNNALNEENYALQNGRAIKKFEMPMELKNVINEVPFDTTFLHLGFFEYPLLLHYYVNNKIYNPNYDLKNWKNVQYQFPVKTNDLIRSASYPTGIEEYLLAKDIQYWLSIQGITPAIDSVLHNFKIDFKSSRYLPALQKNYNGWLAISKGRPAPDFSGTTSDGKDVSLDNLKGKVVYVDVWATWCAPCKEEIPHSKKLQKEFEGNDQVEFLYVSIDRDKEAWKKMLLADKDWKGVHINQQREETDLFWKAYKMSGVPTYILIDQAGNIVDAKATRPSEGKVRDQIHDLLNKKI